MKSISKFDPLKNVGDTERLVSAIAGAGLLAFAASFRKWPAALVAAAGAALVYRGASGHCSMYSALGIDGRSEPHGGVSVPGNRGIKVEQAIIVNRPVTEVFHTWRNLENLPKFMSHLEAVTVIDTRRSYWTAKGPAGLHVSWEAEIINEKPDEMISWRSLEGSEVRNAGTVRFNPMEGGTKVQVALEYDPAGGRLGAAVARLFHRDPDTEISEDLVRFKEMIEQEVLGRENF